MSTAQHLSVQSQDQTLLRAGRWGDAPRDVLLLHGLAEHIGRYEHVAARLVQAGWRVTMPELRGHGKSGGKRGYTESWHRYVEDVQATAALIGKPYVLVAHSMGGLVALSTLLEATRPPCVAVALSNPLLGVAVKAPAIKVAAARLLSKIWPTLSLANELDAKAISRDPAVVAAYEADPLVFGTLTPRWFTEMEAAQLRLREGLSTIKLPLHLMLSEADRICDPKAARAVYEAYSGPKTLALYPPLFHELFNEPEKTQVLDELVAWLEQVWTA
jgi:lysophospholipase